MEPAVLQGEAVGLPRGGASPEATGASGREEGDSAGQSQPAMPVRQLQQEIRPRILLVLKQANQGHLQPAVPDRHKQDKMLAVRPVIHQLNHQ